MVMISNSACVGNERSDKKGGANSRSQPHFHSNTEDVDKKKRVQKYPAITTFVVVTRDRWTINTVLLKKRIFQWKI